jgi:hypothetical protein
MRAEQILIVTLALFVSLSLAGCAVTSYEKSTIHPHAEGKAFQECSVDLTGYKSVQLRVRQDPNLALAVAASGGGYRASNFAAGILIGLEEITWQEDLQSSILSEVDYFSSVSGGGFAVGVYISTLHDHRYFGKGKGLYSLADALKRTSSPCPCRHSPAAEELTDPCVRRHLQGLYSDFVDDFIHSLLPWGRVPSSERVQLFERALDDDVLGYRWRKRKLEALDDKKIFGPADMGRNASLNLGDIFVPSDNLQKQVLMPYWVANATVYENGVIFPYTPDHLKLYHVDGYNHRLKEYKYAASKESYEDFIWSMPLSVGVCSSANFPFALPANKLTNKLDSDEPYIYLLDGGMSDNLGVITAVRLLENEIRTEVNRKTLIVIDAYQDSLGPFSNEKEAPSIAKTAIRTMEISLDSWRWRYREIIDGLCQPKNIRTVYLSFDDLVEADFNDLIDFGFTEQDRRKLCESISDRVTPFQIARSVSIVAPLVIDQKGLRYELSRPQQNLLIAAGRYVVKKKTEEIQKAVGWQ